MIWRWRDDTDGWRRRFALLPIFLSDGPNRAFVWLQWVWKRDMSQYIEVSLTDPAQARPVPQSAATSVLAERVMQAHEWGYRDPVVGGFVEHGLPFDLAAAVLAQAGETREAGLDAKRESPVAEGHAPEGDHP